MNVCAQRATCDSRMDLSVLPEIHHKIAACGYSLGNQMTGEASHSDLDLLGG